MSFPHRPKNARFSFTVPIVLIAVAFSLQVLTGCSEKEPEKPKKPEVSIENLQSAYAKSIRYREVYNAFMKQAEKERLKNVAALFRAAARSEDIHATNHATLLREQGIEPKMPELEEVPAGTTIQYLKNATSREEIEVSAMYPNMINTAELENYPTAMERFKQTRDADARQAELFQDALDRNARISGSEYFVCPDCGYIITSEKTEQCPNCGTKNEKFERI